jgi:hypothetical protein
MRHRIALLSGISLVGLVLGGLAFPTAVRAAQIFNVITYGADPTGTNDSTVPIRNAIAAAQGAGPGNTVYFPTGNYVTNLSDGIPVSLFVTGPNAVTLLGDGASLSKITQQQTGKSLLSVQSNGSVVNSLTLDTQTNNALAAIKVQANNTTLEHSTLLGGTRTFDIFYPGPFGTSHLHPKYNTGNTVNDIVINDRWTLDGFSFAYQKNATISNITHTGSRLALFVDTNVHVSNYNYTPGPQPGGTSGFWITPPSDTITVDHFNSSGNGGVIGSSTTAQFSTNITVSNEVLSKAGFHFDIGDTKGLTISNCNMGPNSYFRFKPLGQATGVVMKNCTSLPQQIFANQGTVPVSAEYDNDVFPAFTPVKKLPKQTFVNFSGGPTTFAVNGGTFQNCSGGFFKGTNTFIDVNGLAGYPCSADSPPSASVTVAPTSGTVPFKVTADASASTDPDATPVSHYKFDFGDGTVTGPQASPIATHTYFTTGTFTVTATVSDTAGLNSTATQQVVSSGHSSLVGNPSFENGTGGWTVGGGTALGLSSTAHTGAYSAQVTRTLTTGKGILDDEPEWNASTTAGTTCTVSAWVQAPVGVNAYINATELQGTTVIKSHQKSVAGAGSTWVQVSTVAPIVNGGDSLDLTIFATIAVGQALLVDDVSEICF